MQDKDPFMNSTVMLPPSGDTEETLRRRRTLYRIIPSFINFDDEKNSSKGMLLAPGIGKPGPLRSFSWQIHNTHYQYKVESQKITVKENVEGIPFETVINTELILLPVKPHRSTLRVIIRAPNGHRIHLVDNKIQEGYENGVLSSTYDTMETT